MQYLLFQNNSFKNSWVKRKCSDKNAFPPKNQLNPELPALHPDVRNRNADSAYFSADARRKIMADKIPPEKCGSWNPELYFLPQPTGGALKPALQLQADAVLVIRIQPADIAAVFIVLISQIGR